ncbi:hypothetical protein CYMTET_36747, partial [Cymbomonas tetramitiformis]
QSLACLYPPDSGAREQDNWTPLHLAVQHTHEEVTNALLMADADTNIQTKVSPQRAAQGMWGHTPLHWAAMYGIEGLVQLLLDHNASTTTLSKTAKLPRDIAIQNNHDAVLALLDGKVQWWSNEQVQKTVADDKTQCRAPGSAPEAEPAAHPAKQTEDVWAMFDMKQFERLGTFGKLDLGDVFPRDPVNPAPL